MLFDGRVFVLRYHFKNIPNMKNLSLSLILLSALVGQSFAQALPFPDGVYKTGTELKLRKPCVQMPGKVYPGSDFEYSIVPDNKEVHRSFVRDIIMAYAINGELYLNAKHFKVQSTYVKSLTLGRFLFFKGGASTGEASTGMLLGGLIGYAIASSSRHYYLCDLNTGKTKIFKHEKFVEMLQEYPELWAEYSQEFIEENKTEPIYTKYIQKLNDLLGQ